MMLKAPVISWWNVDFENEANTNKYEIQQPYDFGIVNAGHEPEEQEYYRFLIWNNRNSNEYAPPAEDIKLQVRDRDGGLGNTIGREVWAINGDVKWFHAYCESLGETSANFTQIGGEEAKPIGTAGTTVHPDADKAVTWNASTSYDLYDLVKPTNSNGFIYQVIQAGVTGETEPSWSTTDLNEVEDGTIVFRAIRIERTPPVANRDRILGGENDGSLANASGNFARVVLKIKVPLDAVAGRQDIKLRTSYRFA